MLTRKFLIQMMFLLFAGMTMTSCGVVKNLEDITEHANEILEELAELSRTVNSQVETGQLTETLGETIDERIENLAKTVEELLINGGGFVFDEVNGTLNSTFDNVEGLIETLNEEILMGSIPANIQLLSNELLIHSNNLAGHAEDLINLTFGNTSILISQATDAAITIIAWSILGGGLLLIILMLIIFGSKMNKGTRIFVIILVILFLVIPISFLFVPPVKAFVLKSMNVGEEIKARALEPRLVGITPTDYEIGTDDKLIAFGMHLDQLKADSVEIGLYQSDTRKVAFTKASVKVITSSKIILSDFDKSNLNWTRFRYAELSNKYAEIIRTPLPQLQYKNLSVKENVKKVNTRFLLKDFRVDYDLIRQPIKTKVKPNVVNPNIGNRGVQEESQRRPPLLANVYRVMQARYNIAAGDYELRVYKKGEADPIRGSQHVVISYPPPPPPKPDVFPMDIKWLGGNPVKGENAKVQVKLGVIYGEEADKGIQVGMSGISGLRSINVTRSQLNDATSNYLWLTTGQFSVNQPGNFNVTANADAQSRLSESNEGNNLQNKSLRVRDYRFTATVKWKNFVSHHKMDGGIVSDEDEYRIDIITSVPGYSDWKVDYNKNGEPHNTYTINQSKTFTNLPEGARLYFFTAGKEADSGMRGDDDGMGSKGGSMTLNNVNSKTEPIQLKTSHYTINGEVTYTKQIIN
jgi:hypothetical protein